MKRQRIGFILSLAVCSLMGTVMAADKPLDVRDLMTASQFHQTGLDTLNPEQLAAFNAWLADYGHPAAAPAAATKPAPAATTHADAGFGAEMVSAGARDEPDRIETRVVGTFTGWKGGTVFTFENGQTWVQSGPGDFETRLDNPTVVIKRLTFGYLLTLPGQGATVFVKRVH
ncbi:MAG TPA: hypothetical protein VKT74_08215 [Gammaproteobacteria bacterium]|nr:hypothetical protein [Gammaproteobacteria bacterium]